MINAAEHCLGLFAHTSGLDHENGQLLFDDGAAFGLVHASDYHLPMQQECSHSPHTDSLVVGSGRVVLQDGQLLLDDGAALVHIGPVHVSDYHLSHSLHTDSLVVDFGQVVLQTNWFFVGLGFA